MLPSSFPPGHLSQINLNLWSHKNHCRNVCSPFNCNSQNLETTQMSSNTWVDCDTSILGIFLSKKHMRTLIKYNNFNESWNFAEWNKTSPQRLHTRWLSNTWEWKNHRNGEQISGCQELRRQEGEMIGDRNAGVTIKGKHQRSLWWQKCSVSWLFQCQYPSYNIVL